MRTLIRGHFVDTALDTPCPRRPKRTPLRQDEVAQAGASGEGVTAAWTPANVISTSPTLPRRSS